MTLMFAFFSWWYGTGWFLVAKKILNSLTNIVERLSVGILLKTLFYPWKRITITPESNLSAKFQAALDNLVSRVVGFFVRLWVLIFAFIISILILILGILQLILWPLVPLLFFIFIGIGIYK